MRAKKMKNCIFSSQQKLEDGQIKEVTTKLRIRANRKPRPFKRKEFDPRTDKMLDINSNEDFLMESLKNFRPPQERSLNQS